MKSRKITTKSAKELTIEWHNRVWNNRDEDAIYELMDDKCIVHGLDLTEPGPKGFVRFHRQYFEIWDNIQIDIFEMIEDGNLAIGHARVTGIHKPTQNKIDAPFSISVKWQDGKIIEARNVVDYVTLLTQMGALQPEIMVNAFATAKEASG
ncbi:MAG: ester cyclase [Verrucomicrobia bacterium]|nr:ester cyclase [Verrucomicrobiota bacterium]